MPGAKRYIDKASKTIKMEFANGQTTFDTIELNEVTDALTRMIAALEGRVVALEAKTGK